jgi:hypothetical protein
MKVFENPVIGMLVTALDGTYSQKLNELGGSLENFPPKYEKLVIKT